MKQRLLDADSEEIVQNAIINLTKNKTTLVIAHRLSTIHNADKIFVMKNGEIINSGNHQFLIENCEEYKSLYQKQLNKNDTVYRVLLLYYPLLLVYILIRKLKKKEDRDRYKEKFSPLILILNEKKFKIDLVSCS